MYKFEILDRNLYNYCGKDEVKYGNLEVSKRKLVLEDCVCC
jgi:hypothetical protein